MPKPKINQPTTLVFNNVKYRRVMRFKDLGAGITEGPFYQPAIRFEETKDLWLPDLAWVLGQNTTLLTMHRITIN